MTKTIMIAHGGAAVQAARIIAGVAAGKERQRVYDKTGREVMVGDVLKVYHFTAAMRRKRHYMYKQVVAADHFSDGTPVLRISHLDMTDDGYTLVCDGNRLADYEIVQSVKCDHEDRPRHTAAP